MNIFRAPAIITKITTMSDNTLRLQVDCQEMDSQDEVVILKARNKYGWFLFKETDFTESDIDDLPDIPKPKDADSEKSKSQRQRNALHVLWEKRGKKDMYGRECDSDTFYNQYMETHIQKIKDKIHELE